jgi:hypothetical protein
MDGMCYMYFPDIATGAYTCFSMSYHLSHVNKPFPHASLIGGSIICCDVFHCAV